MTAGVALAHFTMPTPDAKLEERKGRANLEKAIKAREISEMQLANLESEASGMWEGAPESITAQILQSVTVIAKAQGITMKSFRPQTAIADGDLSRNNYLVLLEGSFPQVVAFARSIDTPSSRLGISLVQVAAADQESDAVNASIGIVAYVKMPEVEKKPNPGTNDKTSKEAVTKNEGPNKDNSMNEVKKETSLPTDKK